MMRAKLGVTPNVIAADWALVSSAFLSSYSNPVSGALVGGTFAGIATYKTAYSIFASQKDFRHY
jgi:hypothetical protein